MAKTSRPHAERTDEHVYDDILMENIPTARELSHENTLNEPKDTPHMRVLTDLTTSIRHIKVVGLVLTIMVIVMVIVMATSIGVLLSELKKKCDATEGKIDAIELKTTEAMATVSQLEFDRTKYNESIQQHTYEIAQLESNRTKDLATIQLHNTRITDLEEGAYQVGFSAQGNNRTTAGVLRFTSIKTNIGYEYSSSTGAFTCSHPGLYYFSLSLIKHRASSGTDMVYCYIRKNGSKLSYTRIDPNDGDADAGSYGTSTSLVVHLTLGDKVDVGSCSVATSIDEFSTFSGFLLQED